MLNLGKKSLMVLLAFALLVVACSKNEDENPPTIEILQPTKNAGVDGLGTIPVRAQISDESNIVRVTVFLADAGLKPVDQSVVREPNATDFLLELSYEVTDIRLPAGSYFLVIRAFDGRFETTSSVPIKLREVERERKGILYLTGDSFNDAVLHSLDNTLDLETVILPMETNGFRGLLSSLHQQYYFHETASNSLRAIDLNTRQTLWEKTFFSTVQEMELLDEKVFVNTNDEGMIALDHFGTEVFSAQHQGKIEFGRTMFLHKDMVYAYELTNFSSDSYLSSYLASGELNASVQVSFRIKKFFALDEEHLLLFAEGQFFESAAIYSYHTESHAIVKLLDYETRYSLYDVVETFPGYYVAATENEIIQYDAAANTMTPILPGVRTFGLTYDPMQNELLLATENKVVRTYQYTPTSTLLLGQYPEDVHVNDIQVWYNK